MEARQSPLRSGRPVYVVDGCRSPFLKAKGRPGPFRASDLALTTAQNLFLRLPIEPHQLDEVILGCVMPGPEEANIARVVALRLGCGERVTAWTVQRNCASGMQALDSAATDIACGRSDLVLAGGVEAMSHAPVLLNTDMVAWLGALNAARSPMQKLKALAGFRPRYLAPVVGLMKGLTDATVGLNMGQTAEIIAHRFNISREAMDRYAVESHERLASAMDAGHLDEVVPAYDHKGRVYTEDSGLRRDTDFQRLASLKPAFDRPFGKVTAGNSAQITDGAAWLLLASEEAVKKYDLPVIGKLLDSEWAGLDPAQMGLGPVHAMAPIMERATLDSGDIDRWEINEAFAAQVLACLAAWTDEDYCRAELGRDGAFSEIDRARLNVDGGGISIGHPVGASGARIVLHLLHALKTCGGKTGMASLCIGGGQGGAMLVASTENTDA